ncbi:preprotein translocase subunit SecG [Hydrogenoanaerobacterium saccharovorans]|uniref:Protein-export membrane protein SecG n=1 Tax=Hydrogenoanaerobacterium saccharovorans TaxID=474960 RepID=A0A1H8AR07_9FIRM|nr:preprotein translocase subunit SecG [Hydrogenoanaerobacterium saccharovorans]RPF47795.1 preprotein translocase subunit SecG [Hydrogenoanaerobacterium saccharovorans]SEM73170.1 preprotein translocase subunit SecG [Hydrogenoanaerobacterium saccharovorans]
MNAFEIVGGIVLAITCIIIVLVVMMQESKSDGMSAVSGADSAINYGKNRAKTKEMLLNKVTKVAAVIFFAISLAVCIISVYVK